MRIVDWLPGDGNESDAFWLPCNKSRKHFGIRRSSGLVASAKWAITAASPFGPRNRSRSRRRMRLRWANSISTFFPQLPGCSARVDLGDVTGPVASALVDGPGHLARGCLRGRPRLYWACVAVMFAGAIEECRAVVHQRPRASAAGPMPYCERMPVRRLVDHEVGGEHGRAAAPCAGIQKSSTPRSKIMWRSLRCIRVEGCHFQ